MDRTTAICRAPVRRIYEQYLLRQYDRQPRTTSSAVLFKSGRGSGENSMRSEHPDTYLKISEETDGRLVAAFIALGIAS